MREIVKSVVRGEDGSSQIITTNNSLKGRGGDDFQYVSTVVNGVEFRPIRRNNRIVRFDMVQGLRRYAGPWESVTIKDITDMDESSEISEFYLSPDKKWIYKAQRIHRGLRAAALYKIVGQEIVPVRFSGLRLDDYLVTQYLQRINRKAVEKNLYDRIVRFEQWENEVNLRCNLWLTYYGGPVKQTIKHSHGAVFYINLQKVLAERITDVSNQNYNYFPNKRNY
jgi:hypothetical protein